VAGEQQLQDANGHRTHSDSPDKTGSILRSEGCDQAPIVIALSADRIVEHEPRDEEKQIVLSEVPARADSDKISDAELVHANSS
jgi:hypothetical protein